MTYDVVLEESDEGFSAHCPALPGCWSEGDTREEALENIREAIQDYLACILGHPDPASVTVRSSSG